MSLGGYLFVKLQTAKSGVTQCPKSRVPEHSWTLNMLNSPKHCMNLPGSIFVRVFDQSLRKSTPKSLFQQYLKS